MGEVLYEVHFELKYHMVFILIVCAFFWPSPWFIKKFCRWLNLKPNDNFWPDVWSFYMLASGFLIVILIITIWFPFQTTRQMMEVYESGDYQLVEGRVENFKTITNTGAGTESFTIQDIPFEYDVSTPGYNKAKVRWGVITGNGQHLRIGYTKIGTRNIILYIEQCAD